jgi:hypothetical protein
VDGQTQKGAPISDVGEGSIGAGTKCPFIADSRRLATHSVGILQESNKLRLKWPLAEQPSTEPLFRLLRASA